MNANTVLVI